MDGSKMLPPSRVDVKSESDGVERMELRAGEQVREAFGVTYLAGEVRVPGSVEAVEFLLGGGASIVLSCGTDWTLHVSEGRWPLLPEWCWPTESWGFKRIPEIGDPGIDYVTSVAQVRDAVGEVCGTRLEFPAAWVTVKSGERMTVNVSHKGS